MRKVILYLSVVSFSNLLSANTEVDKKNSDSGVIDPNPIVEIIEQSGGSRNTLSRYMNPPLRQHFRRLQWEVFLHPADLSLADFYYSFSDQLAPLFEDLKKVHEERLQVFSNIFSSSMTLLTKDFPGRYSRIFRIAQNAALDLGFSAKVIDNIEVYHADGSKNALTVSGTSERIIIVINSELVAKLSNSDIRSVLFHEMGHIRAFHTVQSSFDNLFLSFLDQHIATKLKAELMAEAINNKENVPLTKTNAETSPVVGQVNKSIIAEGHDHSSLSSDLNDHPIMVYLHDKEETVLSEALGKLQSQSTEKQNELAILYLSKLIEVLKSTGSSQIFIEYLTEVQSALIKNESLKPFAQRFTLVINKVTEAISRAREFSADNFSLGHVPNEHVGSSLLKISGLEFDVKDRDLILQLTLKQAKKLIETVSPDELAFLQGTTHPSHVLRVAHAMEQSSFPQILFANPFLRLVIFEDYLRNQQFEHPSLAVPLNSLQNDIVSLIVELGLDRKSNPRLTNLLQYVLVNKITAIYFLASSREKGHALNSKLLTEMRVLYLHDNPILENLRGVLLSELNKLKLKKTKTKFYRMDTHIKLSKRIEILEERLRLIDAIQNSDQVAELKKLNESISTQRTDPKARAKQIPVETNILTNPTINKACRAIIN